MWPAKQSLKHGTALYELIYFDSQGRHTGPNAAFVCRLHYELIVARDAMISYIMFWIKLVVTHDKSYLAEVLTVALTSWN